MAAVAAEVVQTFVGECSLVSAPSVPSDCEAPFHTNPSLRWAPARFLGKNSVAATVALRYRWPSRNLVQTCCVAAVPLSPRVAGTADCFVTNSLNRAADSWVMAIDRMPHAEQTGRSSCVVEGD